MPTYYKPSDGDYIDDDYGQLLNDMQIEAGYDFGAYLEICVSLESDNTIRVLGSNDEGDEWEWDQSFQIPHGWDLDRIRKMFEGNVYLEPQETGGSQS